jgi:hypothetical protein
MKDWLKPTVLSNGVGTRPLAKQMAGEHEHKPSAVFCDCERFLQQVPGCGTAHGLDLGVQLSLDAIELLLYVWMGFW